MEPTVLIWKTYGCLAMCHDPVNSSLYILVLSDQLLRKRHIGNDIVTIVFQEPGALPFTPKSIRSHFQHVFIIIQVHEPGTDHTYYRWFLLLQCHCQHSLIFKKRVLLISNLIPIFCDALSELCVTSEPDKIASLSTWKTVEPEGTEGTLR